MTQIEQVIDRAVDDLLALEFQDERPPAGQAPVLAAIGTVAPRALASPLLRGRLTQAGVQARHFVIFDAPSTLIASTEWQLALVLSPFKREVGGWCDRLTPTATASGVVDTMLRAGDLTVGINTNAYAAAAALRYLLAEEQPSRVLIAGTGATARSAALGATLSYPTADLAFIGRARKRAEAVVRDVGRGQVVADPAAYSPDLVINTTTVGETDDRATLAFDLASAFGPGVRFFDVNNRASALQTTALAAGCVVMSGIVMQTVTNALRAALLAPRAGAG